MNADSNEELGTAGVIVLMTIVGSGWLVGLIMGFIIGRLV